MGVLFAVIESIAPRFLRYSLAVILIWIGALKFIDPSPVVGLLQASLPFLASAGFVYLLGVVEIIVGIALLAGFMLRYAGLVTLGLFAGTLTIFLIAPAVTGLPLLTLAGQFLLKDLVLFGAALNVIAMDTRTETRRMRMAHAAK
jgi:uncharacterized membrane protein YkgB